MTNLRIGILDQTISVSGKTERDAVQDVIKMSREADRLGFYRYWVTEHHNSNASVSAAPEVMIPAIASVTKNMRIGSAGVLIPYYSPFKIAEQFNLLENLFPGRIDIGIGRAPGGDLKTALKVNPNFDPQENSFKKIDELLSIFENSNEKYEPGKPYVAHPRIKSEPEIWILGTSTDSALYAAERGLQYSFASFISDEQRGASIETYYKNFKPSKYLDKPYINLAIFAICAETKDKASELAKCSEMWLVEFFLHKKNIKLPSPSEAEARVFTPEEKIFIEYRRKSAVIGDQEEVRSRLLKLATELHVHEITILSFTYDFEDRLNSYRLIADAVIGKETVS